MQNSFSQCFQNSVNSPQVRKMRPFRMCALKPAVQLTLEFNKLNFFTFCCVPSRSNTVGLSVAEMGLHDVLPLHRVPLPQRQVLCGDHKWEEDRQMHQVERAPRQVP